MAATLQCLPFVMPAGLIPKPSPQGNDSRLDQMLKEGAPRSAMKVFTELDRIGRFKTGDQRHGYAYPYITTLAKELNIAPSTVRVRALPWLVAHGWITEQKVIIGGKSRTLYWCLWLLPFAPQAARDVPPPPAKKPRTRKPATEQFSTPGAHSYCYNCAPDNPYGLEESNKKTTTDVEEVVVFPASRLEEGEKPEPSEPPQLHPELAKALDHESYDDDDRAELTARLPDWIARHQVAAVIKVILEMAAARKAGKKIASLTAYAEGILKNWLIDGKPSMRHAKPPPLPEQNRTYTEDEATKRKAEARRAEAIKAAKLALWEALPELEKAAFLAEAARDPDVENVIPPMRKNFILQGAQALFEGRQQP
jgi:hypothetical protein